LDDATIIVEGYVPDSDPGIPVSPENITKRDNGIPDDKRAQTAAIVDMLAQGYIEAEESFAKALKFDEQYLASLRARLPAMIEEAKKRAQEIDSQFQLTAKLNEVSQNFWNQAAMLDSVYHISEKFGLPQGQGVPIITKGLSDLQQTFQSFSSFFGTNLQFIQSTS